MEYHNKIITNEGFTLSIDKVVIDYYLSNLGARNNLINTLDTLPIRYAVNVTHWSSLRIGAFRENYTVEFQNGNSFWIGAGLNTSKPLWGRTRLEFNPNKCAAHAAFLSLLEYVNVHSRRMHTAIKRYDLAIDLPAERVNVHLLKDNRVYSEFRRSQSDCTQYLGAKSSAVGRVKLYNKQIEAKLSFPLTRLELTLDPATPFRDVPWPKAYYIATRQIGMEEIKVTDTERFVLGALLEGYGALTDLGRRTRAKMESLLSRYVRWVSISPDNYNLILAHLQSFLNHPLVDLGVGNADPDQPPTPIPEWVWVGENAKSTGDAGSWSKALKK